jgi:bla regulator protein BlaR1
MGQVLISALMAKIIPAFCWVLIHSLWQGLLFAIITGVVLMLTKKSNAAYRYNLILVLFIGFIASCALTFVFELNNTAPGTLKPLLPGNGGIIVPTLFFGNVYGFKQFINTLIGYFSANQPLLVLIWFIIFMFKSVKMMGCLVYNQQIRVRQITEPSEFWVKTVTEFAKKLQITKAVTLLQSGYIKMPVVVGHLKPVILIPIGLLAGLPAEQVEAILLHELAHIRRNDYFVNFIQNIAETIFFFNPGLLWISALLREERENCCDDIALEQTQNKVGFVEALISFKEHELYGSRYAVAFPGKKNYLMRRVSRILSNKNKTFGLGEKIFFIGSILILSVLVTAASVAQIKEYAKISLSKINAARHINKQKTVAGYNAVAVKVLRYPAKHTRVKVQQKMNDGIAGIQGKSVLKEVVTTALAPVSRINPVNNQKELSERDQAEKDQIQARKDKAQAKIDQEQAMKDQVQAKIDLAEALKDQAQAQIDQEQGKKGQPTKINKDEVQADKNNEQANRNRVQVYLNKLQDKKNQEQVVRNEEQARLNQIQEKKNEEQAVRNEEKARLNQIQ